MLDSIEPGTVSVWSCGGSTECAHWGEIMSTAAAQRGCIGAVIDGGVRDVDFINEMDYPVFARFKSSPVRSDGGTFAIIRSRFALAETTIHPGDFVFGDTDGVVIVPAALTLEVLESAEDIFEREGKMRAELRQGISVKDAYAKYGSLVVGYIGTFSPSHERQPTETTAQRDLVQRHDRTGRDGRLSRALQQLRHHA